MNTIRRSGGSDKSLPLQASLVVLILGILAGLGWALATQGSFMASPGLLLAVVGTILAIPVAWLLIRSDRSRAEEQEAQNRQNQEAILQLIDELGGLADGDLRVNASVTENFTGAIADSINFAIDQMRGLVSDINRLSVQVAAAADETQSTAKNLTQAADHQAREIVGASTAINDMASSIDQVSMNASESAAVADRAVEIAGKGGEVVRNTIGGMDRIRGQIQETSKRIKRLGESSQEIGDIVSLINDIADQTNILSLNAAIQASMAGDAGRGFAVVADEVQRLAERASAATKQIAALVKTIQTDTNEAVISMEQTTTEVVQGARLAQDAGVALEEIEGVSKSLAELIQNISNAARQQAAAAGHISNTMTVIQEITSTTSASTEATARSIGELATVASQMRHSVQGFKLPEQAPALAAQTPLPRHEPAPVDAAEDDHEAMTTAQVANG
jgi:twitching motility protein PilJ